MSYTGFVCQIKNLRNHPNGDNLYLGECFDNTVAVSRNGYTPDMIGVYFPEGGQLSVEFAEKNNLLRLKGPDGHTIPGGGYMDPDKRNVTAIRLRGNKSDGLFLPLSCLDYCFEGAAAAHLKLGDTIDVVNGHEICQKYIPHGKKQHANGTQGNHTRKKKAPIAPLFIEHADTEQLAYNLDAFHNGDLVEITLKMHGTSQRTGYLPVLSGYKRSFLDWLLGREGKPVYKYDLISGTRRTVLESAEGGFYGSNEFRFAHAETFRGKLHKGEEVYYEVVGYVNPDTPIMPSGDNRKLKDKDFVKQYGPTTTFSYGCDPGQSDIYVYRMTMTNEDGDVVEYTPDFMRYRCEQMGVKTVPVFWQGYIPENPASPDDSTISPGHWIKNVAEQYYDGPDPVGKTHVREGVVIRLINKPKFCAYKHKNYSFKCLSGIAIAEAEEKDTILDADIASEM